MAKIAITIEHTELKELANMVDRALGKTISEQELPIILETLLGNIAGELTKKARFVLSLKDIADAAVVVKQAACISVSGLDHHCKKCGVEVKRPDELCPDCLMCVDCCTCGTCDKEAGEKKKWVVTKKTRSYNGGPGYEGKVFDKKEKAEEFAKQKSKSNPSGFDVIEHKKFGSDSDQDGEEDCCSHEDKKAGQS